jgi:hypothetical protein
MAAFGIGAGPVQHRHAKALTGLSPAISAKAKKAKGRQIRAWHLGRRSGTDLSGLAEASTRRWGWVNYYGAFYSSELRFLAWCVNEHLARWAMHKFKRFRGKYAKAWPGCKRCISTSRACSPSSGGCAEDLARVPVCEGCSYGRKFLSGLLAFRPTSESTISSAVWLRPTKRADTVISCWPVIPARRCRRACDESSTACPVFTCARAGFTALRTWDAVHTLLTEPGFTSLHRPRYRHVLLRPAGAVSRGHG